jgi:hypothetical protein
VAAAAGDIQLVEKLLRDEDLARSAKLKTKLAMVDPAEVDKRMELDELPNRLKTMFSKVPDGSDSTAAKLKFLQSELDRLKKAAEEKVATAPEKSDKELLLSSTLYGQPGGSQSHIPPVNTSGAGTSAVHAAVHYYGRFQQLAPDLPPVEAPPAGSVSLTKYQKFGMAQTDFYNRWKSHPIFKVDDEKLQLGILPEQQRENTRVMDMILDSTFKKFDRQMIIRRFEFGHFLTEFFGHL